MSTNMASFRIHEDQENLNELKRPQRVTRATKAVEQQKRSVLGVLNKNSSRSQSQKTSKEEVFSRAKTQAATFSILEDKEVTENKPLVQKTSYSLSLRNAKPISKRIPLASKPAANLPSAVTNVHRPPLQELPVLETEEEETEDNDDVCEGSPMTLDSSVETIIFRAEVLHIQPTLDHLLECEEYKDEIYAYLLEAETRNCPKPYYMKKQPDISYSMRSILVDWLVEVAEEYNLQTETLYLAVGYIDRFLSFMSVVRAKLQLVGTAAMFIASKYEEIYPPDVGEFVYITDDTYTKKQVLRMEHLILKVLSFDLSRPTTLCFIVNLCAATKVEEKIQFLAMYMSELALLYADPFLQYAPSLTAAACIALAQDTARESPTWPPELQAATGYSLDRLEPCIDELRLIHRNAGAYPQQAVREKYRSSRRHNVADISPHHRGEH